MRNLIPAKQLKTFQTEVYGVLNAQEQSYLPRKLVDVLPAAKRHTGGLHSEQDSIFPSIWVAIDPAGHSVSEMGISAGIVCPHTNRFVIIGIASVPVAQCQMKEVQAAVRAFAARIRRHRDVHRLSPIVPIVECNNNEVVAMSIVKCFAPFGPVWLPFTKTMFKTHIADGIGVRTTQDNKMQMIQQMYVHLMDRRIVFSSHVVVAGKNDYDPRVQPPDTETLLSELCDQLVRIKDQQDGTISGKTAAGDNDDLAMAAMMMVYWSVCVRAAETRAF